MTDHQPDYPPAADSATTTDQPRKAWYRRWWAMTLGALIVLFVLIAALGGGGDTPTATVDTDEQAAEAGSAPAEEPEAEPAEEPAQEPEAAGIGDTLNDGQFDFVVTAVEPPVETVGEDFMAEEAQGQFVIVRVTVTNVGDEARTLDSSSQYLYDADGRKYETSGAIFTLPDYDKAFLQNINPGNTVTDAPLLYDVPDGFVPTSIELHDSPFSGGVTVALG
jgi:hypothetical protein